MPAEPEVLERRHFLSGLSPSTWTVVFFTCVCLGFGSYGLGERSLWGDEGATYAIASQHGVALYDAIARDGGNFAIYYLGMHFVIAIFGSGTLVLRIPSVLFSAATVPVTYLLARRLFPERAAIYASGLEAVSLPIIYWGQMARGYTLATLLCVAATLFFVRAIEDGRRVDYVLYGLFLVLLCYTVLLSCLVVVCHLLALLFKRRGARGFRALSYTLIVSAVACVPLLYLAVSRGSSQLFWLGPPTQYNVADVADFLASATAAGTTAVLGHLLSLLSYVLLGLVLLTVPFDRLRRGEHASSFPVALCLCWMLAVPAISYVVSKTFQPVFLDRYFSICLPAVVILLGGLFQRIPLRGAGSILFVGFAVLRIVQIPPTYGRSVDDWRGATQAVLTSTRPGDCIAFFSNDGWVDFNYYSRGATRLPRPVLPAIAFGRDVAVVERYDALSPTSLKKVKASCTRTYLVAAHTGHPWGTPASRAVNNSYVKLRDELHNAYSQVHMRYFTAVTIFLYSDTPKGSTK